MLSNLASSLILHKKITTTVAKAKALRRYVEPLITKSKLDTTHSRRVVFSYLQNKESVQILFDEVAEKISARPGGYTRILKTGNRLGDNAEMCVIELVDYNEALLKEAKPDKAKSKRRRRGGKSKAKAQPAQVNEVKEEAENAAKEDKAAVKDSEETADQDKEEVVEVSSELAEPAAVAEEADVSPDKEVAASDTTVEESEEVVASEDSESELKEEESDVKEEKIEPENRDQENSPSDDKNEKEEK